MTIRPGDWALARQVFEEALSLPENQRAAHIARMCGDDIALREEIAKMLASHERATGFLSVPAVELPAMQSAALAGQRIGPYELLSLTGAGGMGDVYRARDTRLGRTIAIKVLRTHAAGDAEALERFDREARAIASLSHPHICALYDVGDAVVPVAPPGPASATAALRYLVMEYLEGETLAARLTRGPLPLAHALRYAAQMASALNCAHRAGVVHRDLKPANVMLVKNDAKLLDFGLARPVVRSGTTAGDLPTAVAESSITTPGMIVGTVQYMAPEQLKGQDADHRTDVFAFGATLYEMVTGTKAFAADDTLSVAAAILEREPAPLRTLLPTVPPALVRFIDRCLAKDPDERWQSTSDMAFELRALSETHVRPADEAGVAEPSSSSRTPRRIILAGVGLALTAAAAVIAYRPLLSSATSTAPPSAAKHFVVTIPDLNRIGNFALVPDGSGILYTSRQDRRVRLHGLGSNAGSRTFADTEGTSRVFVSPDGRTVGSVREGLHTQPMDGGPSRLRGDVGATASADIGADRTIVTGAMARGLWRLPSAGDQQPEALTTLGADELGHLWPRLLPGGKAVLFTVLGKRGVIDDARVEVLTLANRERRVLLTSAASPLYASSGHLLYASGTNLLAAPFDVERLAVTGEPFLVLSGVHVQTYLDARIDLSADGTLAYLPGAGEELERTLLWMDRRGVATPIGMGDRPYAHQGLLPNQREMVVEIEGATHNIWHQNLATGVLTPLTTGAGNHRPVLSADGRLMVFSSDRTTPRSLFVQPTDGSGQAVQLVRDTGPLNATSWTSDGRWVAFERQDRRSANIDIWVVPMQGDRRAQPFLQAPFVERHGAFSPDGRWMAYTSNETGRPEVMVTAFPGPGPHLQVSTGGGSLPVFSHDGRHLLYRQGDAVWEARRLSPDTPSFDAPRRAFSIPNASPNVQLPFPLSTDGKAILYAKPSDEGYTRVHVIVNFLEELKRLAEAAKTSAVTSRP